MLPIAIVAIGMTLVLGMAFFAFSGPNAAKAGSRRIEALRERHSDSKAVAQQLQMKRILSGAKGTKLDGVAARYLPNPQLLAKRLEMTGKNITLGKYVLGCLGLAVVIAALTMIKGMPLLLSLLLGAMVGLGLPYFAIGKMIKMRVAGFTKRFPDAIELMVRGLRSGLPITETVGIVASEIPGPVGVEFRSISDKMKIGRTMEAALQETADRMGTPEFQFFTITLAIQRETGGNLSETLSNLADVLRKRSQMKLKIKAMSSESKASAYIVGSLPFIVFGLIYSINPGYVGGFFFEPRLMVAGLGGLVWMSLGVFIMAKMVSFEI